MSMIECNEDCADKTENALRAAHELAQQLVDIDCNHSGGFAYYVWSYLAIYLLHRGWTSDELREEIDYAEGRVAKIVAMVTRNGEIWLL